MLAAIRDRTTWSHVEGGKQASWTPGHVRVPKNSVLRSKGLLKPQPIPHQYWGLELRTSLTKAGDGAKCGAKFADTSCISINKATSTSEMREEIEHCSL
jgi:hypothetical protein